MQGGLVWPPDLLSRVRVHRAQCPRSYARMHDAGQTVDTPDTSRHIRPHSDRSAHGGGAFYSIHGNGAAFDALNEEREAEAEAAARNSMQASRPSMQGERGMQPSG